jgi:CheY-like chemotaxis protein
MNNRTILLVDDTPQIRKLIHKIVAHMFPEYDVIGVDSAQEALKRIEQMPPALIISDLQMPELDGFDLMQLVYERYDYRDVAFMLISSWASHGDDSQIRYELEDRGLPVVPIACKPINVHDLQQKITMLLSTPARQAV